MSNFLDDDDDDFVQSASLNSSSINAKQLDIFGEFSKNELNLAKAHSFSESAARKTKRVQLVKYNATTILPPQQALDECTRRALDLQKTWKSCAQHTTDANEK